MQVPALTTMFKLQTTALLKEEFLTLKLKSRQKIHIQSISAILEHLLMCYAFKDLASTKKCQLICQKYTKLLIYYCGLTTHSIFCGLIGVSPALCLLLDYSNSPTVFLCTIYGLIEL